MIDRVNGKRLWYVATIVLLLFLWVLFMRWTVNRADRAMRSDLLQQANLVAQAVNIKRLQALTGTVADVDTPNYMRLKEQLSAIKNANVSCRFIYFMGRKTDGRVFFFLDNEPVGSENEVSVGQIYKEISPEYLRVFDERRTLTVGPVTDQWGTWITALIPLKDPKTGDLLSVMGMDIDARTWNEELAYKVALPVGLMCVLLIGVGTVLLSYAHSVDASPNPVLKRLMPSFVAMLLVLILGTGIFEWYQHKQYHAKRIAGKLSEITNDLNIALKSDAAGMAIAIQTIVADKRVHKALLAGDRSHLLADWKPIFNSMKKDNQITRFYFLDSTRALLLRLQEPEKYG